MLSDCLLETILCFHLKNTTLIYYDTYLLTVSNTCI